MAFAASKVYARLVPSMGDCAMPSTVSGARMPAASRMVGTMSITWWNWSRVPPRSLIRAGQEMAMPWRTPPKCEATCLVQLKGVLKAQLQGTAMWL